MNRDPGEVDAKAGNSIADGLAFKPSDSNTVGFELELQIIDPQTGDLAPGSVRILKACQEEGLPGITAELMQSMIEVKTGVHRTVREARDELLPLLRRVRIAKGASTSSSQSSQSIGSYRSAVIENSTCSP